MVRWKHILIPCAFLLLLATVEYALFMDAYTVDWRMAYFENIDSHGMVRALLEMFTQNHFITLRDPFAYYGTFFIYLSYFCLIIIEWLKGTVGPLDAFMAERWICFIFSMGSMALYFPFRRAFRLPAWFPYLAIFSTLTIPDFLLYSFFPKPETLQFFFILLSLIFIQKLWDTAKLSFYLLACLSAALATAAKWNCFFYIFLILVVDILAYLKRFPTERKIKVLGRSVAGILTFVFFYLLLNLRWLFDFEFSLHFVLELKRSWDQELNSQLSILDWLTSVMSFGYFSAFAFSMAFINHLVRFCKRRISWKNIDLESLLFVFVLACIMAVYQSNRFSSSPRYVLFLVPIIFLGAARFIEECAKMMTQTGWIRGKQFRQALVTGIFVILIGLGDQNRIRVGIQAMEYLLHSKDSDRAYAGNYLLQRYPKETTFYFYFNWWVPESFTTAWPLRYCLTDAKRIVTEFNPDVILLIAGPNPNCQTLIDEFEQGAYAYHRVARLPENSQEPGPYLIYEKSKEQRSK